MRPLPTMPLQVFLATLLAGLFLTFGYTETALNNRASARHLEQSTGQSLQRLAFEMNDKLDRGMFERARDIQAFHSRTPVTLVMGGASVLPSGGTCSSKLWII